MNDLKDLPVSGGISFKTPIFSFGNTTPDINSGFNFDLPLAVIQSFASSALDFASQNSNANRGFISNTIQTSQSNVNATSKEVTDVQSQSLSTLQKFGSYMSDILSPQSGCFITTAICETMGLPDDCEYLTILRNFRDNVLLKNEKYEPLVRQYYIIAPSIVNGINSRSNRTQIYLTLRDEYLLPCIEYIKKEDTFKAVQLYREMVIAAEAYSEEMVNG